MSSVALRLVTLGYVRAYDHIPLNEQVITNERGPCQGHVTSPDQIVQSKTIERQNFLIREIGMFVDVSLIYFFLCISQVWI
jgi:hypothetical protein